MSQRGLSRPACHAYMAGTRTQAQRNIVELTPVRMLSSRPTFQRLRNAARLYMPVNAK